MTKVMLSAGGTGGHLFPAEALAKVLRERNVEVVLLTDDRGLRFGERFPAAHIHSVPSGTVTGRGGLARVMGVIKLLFGILVSLWVVYKERPDVAIGFGGYPTVPPLLAAKVLRIPIFLHEQNAVLGRANGFLLKFAAALATGFKGVKNLPDGKFRIVHTGNPVRAVVLALKGKTYVPPSKSKTIRIVVFGGSQGARVMADVIAPALTTLPMDLRKKLHLSIQVRPEDLDRVRLLVDEAKVKAEVAAFFVDLPERMAKSHLVIGRSGASTVTELSVLAVPSLLIPLPQALDQDQMENARLLSKGGAALVLKQGELTVPRMEKFLTNLLQNDAKLVEMAEQARFLGIPDAAERLADLILSDFGGQRQS